MISGQYKYFLKKIRFKKKMHFCDAILSKNINGPVLNEKLSHKRNLKTSAMVI